MVTTTTRSGRVVKEPVRYTPIEKVLDDYSQDEHDDDDCEDEEDDGETLGSDDDDDEEDDDDDEDADKNGNLKDFVTYSDEEEDEDPDLIEEKE
jgi:hypothetical protein